MLTQYDRDKLVELADVHTKRLMTDPKRPDNDIKVLARVLLGVVNWIERFEDESVVDE